MYAEGEQTGRKETDLAVFSTFAQIQDAILCRMYSNLYEKQEFIK